MPSPPGCFASSRPAVVEMNAAGEKQERKYLMHPLIHLKKVIPVLLIALTWFGLSPKGQAVVPAPDGGYPGGNTAEGQTALLNLTTGGYNTAIGFLSLFSNTTGNANTATGAGTLFNNTIGFSNTANGANALGVNTSGNNNSAFGSAAMELNHTGNFNTAV